MATTSSSVFFSSSSAIFCEFDAIFSKEWGGSVGEGGVSPRARGRRKTAEQHTKERVNLHLSGIP